MKYKKIILTSLFSFSLVIPTLISSCSSNSSNKNENNNDNDEIKDNENIPDDSNINKEEIEKLPKTNLHQYSLLFLKTKHLMKFF